jgi:spermidine/putrescine transport system permease protein
MSDGIWGWRAVNAASVLVYVFLFAPIMVTMLLSFNASEFGGFPMTGFSLHWFGVLMQNDIVLAAVRRSLILGALTAVICTVLGILAATALVRYEFRGKEWVNTLLVAPVLIPETVLAVGLLLFIRWLHAPRTFIVLLLGHVMLSLPYVVLVVQARLLGIKRVYEEAALSLGANRLQTFREITLPLLMPAVLAGILWRRQRRRPGRMERQPGCLCLRRHHLLRAPALRLLRPASHLLLPATAAGLFRCPPRSISSSSYPSPATETDGSQANMTTSFGARYWGWNSASMTGHSGTLPPRHLPATAVRVRSRRRRSAILRRTSPRWSRVMVLTSAQVYRPPSTSCSNRRTSSREKPSSRLRRTNPRRISCA